MKELRSGSGSGCTFTPCASATSRTISPIGFLQSVDGEHFQRDQRQKHVRVDIGDDRFRGNRGMRGEIFRAEQTFFFAAYKDEENRALVRRGILFQRSRPIEPEAG